MALATGVCRILRDSKRRLVDADSVTYFLYMRVGYENLGLGDRVFVTVSPALAGRDASKLPHKHKRGNARGPAAFNAPDVFFNDDCKRFPAEITRCR